MPLLPLFTSLALDGATRPDLRAAIISHLRADDDVAALVGTRVYPLAVPRGERLPAVVVQVIGIERPRHLRGPVNIADATVQVAACSMRPTEPPDIAEAIRQALDGFTGRLGSGATSVVAVQSVCRAERDLVDDPENGTGKPLVRTVCEYLIRFREPQPTRLN